MQLSRIAALRQELEHVAGASVSGLEEKDLHRAALDRGLSALCLSGGGIRSASFCLGVVQALARARLLAKFDYLSTVSGGGYIGSWLQNLIHQEPGRDLEAVQDGLAASDPASGKVAALRNYTKYLSPEAGLFSLDLWTDAVLWLRNTLLRSCTRNEHLLPGLPRCIERRN
jgi:Patatin-like phospholipase